MDLWYGFACESLDLLNRTGVLCFIATNNWGTNSGASILRNKIISETKIKLMIDFGSYMIFGDGASVQTMIMAFQRDTLTDDYLFDYRKLTKNNAKVTDAIMILNKSQLEANYLEPCINREFRKNCFLTFSNSKIDSLLLKIAYGANKLNNKDLAQGIVFPQDFLNNKGHKILPNIPIGKGIFGLTDKELDDLHLSQHEKTLIKPYFTTEQIHRYYTDRKNSLWLIYTDSSFKNPHSMDFYPLIKKHLDNYLSIFTSDNKPYGLHRARNEHFFQGSKIISLRKCSGKPTFSYSDFDVYVTQTFFVIQTERFNLKFLTGLLNSKLIEFWLRHKGKMQGGNFQVDKEPLMQIPIKSSPMAVSKIAAEIDNIIMTKQADSNADINKEESNINSFVYQIYGLTDEEIKIIEGE